MNRHDHQRWPGVWGSNFIPSRWRLSSPTGWDAVAGRILSLSLPPSPWDGLHLPKRRFPNLLLAGRASARRFPNRLAMAMPNHFRAFQSSDSVPPFFCRPSHGLGCKFGDPLSLAPWLPARCKIGKTGKPAVSTAYLSALARTVSRPRPHSRGRCSVAAGCPPAPGGSLSAWFPLPDCIIIHRSPTRDDAC